MPKKTTKTGNDEDHNTTVEGLVPIEGLVKDEINTDNVKPLESNDFCKNGNKGHSKATPADGCCKHHTKASTEQSSFCSLLWLSSFP